jgi:UDP-N-acetylglucosamine 3-dehydrogenase
MRLAFLGCGFATRLHSRTLRRFGDVERYYASRDAEKAASFRRRFRGAGEFASYEAAIEDPRIDVVLIATPPSSHLELTEAALRAGKHVIVEKPPFLRARDFDIVEALEREAGRRVFVAENYFYKPLTRTLRELIADGVVGEVRIVSVNALKQQKTGDWRDEPGLAGGGAVYEGGIHWVNFMASLGLGVRGAHGFRPGPPEGPEKSMVAVFEYTGGAVGTLMYSWEIGSPMKGLRLSTVYGTEGAITFESNGLLVGVRGRRKRILSPNPRDLLGYGAMFEDFFSAVRTGDAPRFDLRAARRDLELVEQIYGTVAGRSATTDAVGPANHPSGESAAGGHQPRGELR